MVSLEYGYGMRYGFIPIRNLIGESRSAGHAQKIPLHGIYQLPEQVDSPHLLGDRVCRHYFHHVIHNTGWPGVVLDLSRRLFNCEKIVGKYVWREERPVWRKASANKLAVACTGFYI